MAEVKLVKDEEVDKAINNAIAYSHSKTNYDNIGSQQIKMVGNVKEKKKSLFSKFSDTFLTEDLDNVKEYVTKEIVIPSIKNLIFDSFTNTLQMMIFGSISRDPRSRGGNGYRDYSSISKSSPSNYRAVTNDNNRDRFDFRDLVFTSNRDAEEVLYTLYEYIHEYGHATVADYYNAIPGVSSVYTDKDWGWTDLSDVRIRPVRDGFILTLPRPIYRPDTK